MEKKKLPLPTPEEVLDGVILWIADEITMSPSDIHPENSLDDFDLADWIEVLTLCFDMEKKFRFTLDSQNRLDVLLGSPHKWKLPLIEISKNIAKAIARLAV